MMPFPFFTSPLLLPSGSGDKPDPEGNKKTILLKVYFNSLIGKALRPHYNNDWVCRFKSCLEVHFQKES